MPETVISTKRRISGNTFEKAKILKTQPDIIRENRGIEAKSGLEYLSKKDIPEVKSEINKALECGPLESVFPCSESKILDFLVTFQDYDYSISDIAENSGVGFKTTLEIVKELEDHQTIVNTRNVGRALMYRLNLDSKQAQSITQLATDIAIKRAVEEKESNKIEEAICPQCQLHVHGQEEVKKKFGFRTRRGKQIIQSWCKECR
ncbi:MAG: hypothetical protein HQ505_05695 [Nitrosopumilus sp.]|nr:hypothetical protein [Nitrosopumilus sp.]